MMCEWGFSENVFFGKIKSQLMNFRFLGLHRLSRGRWCEILGVMEKLLSDFFL